MKEIDADSVNGDTQNGVSLAAEKAGHLLAFEPESGPRDEGLIRNAGSLQCGGHFAAPKRWSCAFDRSPVHFHTFFRVASAIFSKLQER